MANRKHPTDDTPSGSPADAKTSPARQRSRARRASKWVGLSVLVLVLLVGAAAGVVWWGLHNEAVTQWALQRAPGLKIEGGKGALLGDYSAKKMTFDIPGGDGQVVLNDFGWRGLKLTRQPHDGAWLKIHLDTLHAERIDYRAPTDAPESEPLQPPTSLRLPIELEIDALQVGEVRAAALGDKPLRDVRAKLHLGADKGTRHRIEGLQLTWDRIAANASLQIGAEGDMPLEAKLGVAPTRFPADAAPSAATAAAVAAASSAASAGRGAAVAAGTPAVADDFLSKLGWRAEATVSGPLAAPEVALQLQPVTPSGGGRASAQSLAAKGTLKPFEPWPLGDLSATMTALDAASFASGAPRTALSGTVQVATRGLDKPADVRVAISNGAAGRWDQGLLPLRELNVNASARPDQPSIVELSRFDATLGGAATTAGRLAGSGKVAPGNWSVDLRLDDLQPALLDARAPPMRLSGPIVLSGTLPQTAAPVAAAASATASGAKTGARTARTARKATPTEPMTIEAKADIAGTMPPPAGRKRAPRVQLALDAGVRLGAAPGALAIDLRKADATMDEAGAALTGTVTRAGSTAPWVVKADGKLSEFDPAPWWPGSTPAAWQKGPHRINATTEVAVSVAQPATSASANANAPTLDQQLAAIDGKASLTLKPSVVGGVPANGTVTVRSTDGAALRAELGLDVAGNRLDANGRMSFAALSELTSAASAPAPRRSAGAGGDHWEMTLAAPALERLAPLIRLVQPADQKQPLTFVGAVSGKAEVDGRWPAITTTGSLQAERLRAGNLSLGKADAQWRLGTASNAPTELKLALSDAALDKNVIPTARLTLDGTSAAHTLELLAQSKAKLPPWTEALQKATPANAANAVHEALVRVTGGLLPGKAGNAPIAALAAVGWRGTVQRVELRNTATPDAPIVRVADVPVEASWGEGAPSAVVQPGRAQLKLGDTAAALKWGRVRWQAASDTVAGRPATPMQLDATAELEPLAIAPILAKVQPGFGWGGDLVIKGQLAMRSTPTFKADVVVERVRGDLAITEEGGITQKLGLSDLRLALNADNGVWNFTQAIAGSTFGVGAGAIVARTSPSALFPPADAPLQGVFELRVEKLASLATWLPTGWRLGGNAQATANFGGRVGAPEITGALRGSDISVRNFLLGVNVREGDIAVALKGKTASIERFSAKGGDGVMRLSGNAELGETPQARLTLTADKFQLLGRVDRRVVASGRAAMRLNGERVALDGNFKIDEGLIDFSQGDAPSLASDVVVMRTAEDEARRAAQQALNTAGSGKPGEPPKSRNIALNVRVNLGDDLKLKGRGLDAELAGELHITSPGGVVAVNGTVRTVGGTYNAYAQKLVIDRGTVTFNGDVANPRLDILALRAKTDIKVGVAVTGFAQNPRVRLYSEPSMSETAKLSYLVLGRAPDNLGRDETAMLQSAALAIVSGEGEGKGDQLTRKLGLDELSFKGGAGGDVRNTVIALGKQVSDRWYVGYEQSLNAAVGSVQLVYRIAQRFTIKAQTGGQNAIDLNMSWRWQ